MESHSWNCWSFLSLFFPLSSFLDDLIESHAFTHLLNTNDSHIYFCSHDLSLSSMLIFSMPTSHFHLDVPQSLQTQPALYYYFLQNKLPSVLSTLFVTFESSISSAFYVLTQKALLIYFNNPIPRCS